MLARSLLFQMLELPVVGRRGSLVFLSGRLLALLMRKFVLDGPSQCVHLRCLFVFRPVCSALFEQGVDMVDLFSNGFQLKVYALSKADNIVHRKARNEAIEGD